MSTGVITRRRTRLGIIVAVGSALVAVGVTGAGLLVPAGEGVPPVRLAAALVALAAAGAAVRLDGAARAAAALIVTSAAAAGVCLATLPASPVALDLGDRDGGDRSVGDAPAGEAPSTDPAIEVVELPDGGDLVLEGGQVVLLLPDGGRTVLGEATVGGAGSLGGTIYQRSDGTRVTIGEGELFDVPAPIEDEAEEEAERVDALIALLLGIFTVLAFAPPFVRFAERRPVPLVDEPEPESPSEPARPPASVEAGLAEVLRSMLADPDPRTSVIGAYARLLTAMAEAGHPRRSEEGPHEHLWRTLGPLGVRRQPVHRLAELFVRARFTPRPVTEEDRQAAIAALADAVADLRLQAHDVEEAAAQIGVVP